MYYGERIYVSGSIEIKSIIYNTIGYFKNKFYFYNLHARFEMGVS